MKQYIFKINPLRGKIIKCAEHTKIQIINKKINNVYTQENSRFKNRTANTVY